MLADTFASEFRINTAQIFVEVNMTFTYLVSITKLKEWAEDPDICSYNLDYYLVFSSKK